MAQSKRLTKEEIKSDQFIDTILGAYDFLKDNLKPIIIGAAVVIVVVGGFSLYQHQRQTERAQAFLTYTEAGEKYQEVESDWLNPEETETTENGFQAVATQFQTIFQRYPGTPVAEKARYDYAKTLYYQGDYDRAIQQFQMIIEKHQPENQILALYAQKAIGNCYEQKGEYENAIQAYRPDQYQSFPKLPPSMREHALADSQFSQARCYEQLGRFDEALDIYQDLIDLFEQNLKKAIQQKSLEFIPRAKSLIAALPHPLDVTAAKRSESEGNYYDALAAYTEAIHSYKIDKDIHGGLTRELRERIHRFEATVDSFFKNLKRAHRQEAEGQISFALAAYHQAVGLDFAPSRNLYEKALLRRDRIRHARQ